MTEETKEPLPSPELYNAELGQWLARQEGHAAAFARYDAFSQSLASGASDIPSRLHQLMNCTSVSVI